MRTSIKFIPILFIVVACGGDDFESSGRTGIDNETDSGLTANGSSDIDSGEGGAGGEANGGTGGTEDVDAGNSAGTGGTAGSGPCIPKTCVTLGIELSGGDLTAESCGVVSDSCSAFIDCGDCSGDHMECGSGDVESYSALGEITIGPAVDNICGGGCSDGIFAAGAREWWYVCEGNDPFELEGWNCTDASEQGTIRKWVCTEP